MIVWILLILYLVILNVIINFSNIKNKNKAFLIFASIGIVFVTGFRNYEYPKVIDMSVYYNYFASIKNIPWTSIFSSYHYNFEYGYIFINKLISTIISWPQAIILAESIICTSSVSYFIYKNSEKPFDSLIYYLSFGLMKFNLTAFRQAIAMSICLLAIKYAKEKKIIPFLLIVIIATLIHKTAFVFIVVYFICNRKVSLKSSLLLLFISFLLIALRNPIINIGNVIFKTNYSEVIDTSFNGIGYLIILLIVIMLSMLSKKEKAKSIDFGINMSYLSFAFFIMSYSMVQLQRIGWYFYYGATTALPSLYPFKSKREQNIFRFIIITISIILMIHRFSGSNYSNYSFFWN